jgi:hypothetical protein
MSHVTHALLNHAKIRHGSRQLTLYSNLRWFQHRLTPAYATAYANLRPPFFLSPTVAIATRGVTHHDQKKQTCSKTKASRERSTEHQNLSLDLDPEKADRMNHAAKASAKMHTGPCKLYQIKDMQLYKITDKPHCESTHAHENCKIQDGNFRNETKRSKPKEQKRSHHSTFIQPRKVDAKCVAGHLAQHTLCL